MDRLKLHLLGTGAAEGYPAIFCKCNACMKARMLGGKDIRTRSSALLDDTIKIDFSADSYHHVLAYNLDLGSIQHFLFTHTHHDHFYPEDLMMRSPVFAHEIPYPLHIYGNDAVMAKCEMVLGRYKEHFQLHRIQPFKTFQIKGYNITPLPADHNPLETCFIFYIEKEGKALLYGHDTGWFPDETWQWLKDKKMDIVLLDCTSGLFPYRRNHMNIEAVKETKIIFEKNGNISENSQVVATHFSHNIDLTHDDLRKLLEPSGIIVAYDGMVVSC